VGHVAGDHGFESAFLQRRVSKNPAAAGGIPQIALVSRRQSLYSPFEVGSWQSLCCRSSISCWAILGGPVRRLIMDEHRIRAAIAADVPAIADIVDQAYRHYIARMGKPPGPMLDDYAARVLEGVVWVLEEGAVVAGIIVLLPAPDYLLLDNIAISPARQGLGLGRRLL